MTNRANREDKLTRRGMLASSAALGFSSVAPVMASASTSGQQFSGTNLLEKFKDPIWNRDMLARIQGNLDFGKVKYGLISGYAIGSQPGKPNMPLVGFEGLSTARLVDNGDGTYQKLLREVVMYTDLETGEVLEEFVNPYTERKVPVVHVANDPFNFVISQYKPEPPSYGGLNKDKPPRQPLLLDWRITREDTVMLTSDIHLFYPAALQPDKWPLESAGPMTTVSELFRYVFRREEVEDESITGLEFSGTWVRITPWFPWLLMGQSPGHITYICDQGAYNSIDTLRNIVSPQAWSYAENNFAKYFDAPTEWVEPSLSSLEHYARDQTPAKPLE